MLIAVTVSICIAAAGYLAWSRAPTYAAHTQLYVASTIHNTRASSSESYAAILLSQIRVASYTQLVSSPPVIRGVIQRLGLSPQDFRAEISAASPPGTVLIDVTVRDRSPHLAKAVADELGRQFPLFIHALETPKGERVAPVTLSVTIPAQLPRHPVAPRKPLYLLLGSLLGLVLGVGGAVIREVLSRRLRDAEDAAAVTGLPVLGSVPDQRRRASPLVMTSDLGSVEAEAYRRVRVNVGALIKDKKARSFMVSSASPSEGKTVVAANLGIAFAQAGHRVVLVDADLRRPTLAELLGLEPVLGLSDVLANRLPAHRALETWRSDLPLEVLAAGSPSSNAAELLGSDWFLLVLDELTARFDVVILDTPALLPATDGAIVARATAGAVLVARANSTRTRQLMEAVDSLRSVDAHVLGIVVNRVPRRSAGRRYGAAYVPELAPRFDRGGALDFPLGVPAEREAR
jgi:polysaccharide biosynthesis transport protein